MTYTNISLLKHEDEAVPILSAQVITILISSSPAVQISIPALKTYFNWLCTMCKKPHTNMQDLAMQYFAGALRSSRNRLIFWDPELTCSNEVVELLKTKKDLQLQYHTLLVVWLITFEKKIAQELNKYRYFYWGLMVGNMILSLSLSKFQRLRLKRKSTVLLLESSEYVP